MTVYVEYVIINNFALDFLLIGLSARVCGATCRLWRRVLASLFGTAFAVALPFIKVDGVAAVSLKLAVGFLMSLIAVSERGVKKSLQCFGLLLAFTFAL